MEGFYGTSNKRGVKLNQQFFIGGANVADISYMENVDMSVLYLNSESPSSPAPAGMDGFRTPILGNHSPSISRARSSNSRGNTGLGSRCAPISLAPLASVENFDSPLFKTPVKVEVLEEDVLVMDGILVGSGTSSKERFSSSESGGSSSSGHNSFYKKDLCRSWEDLSQCRYGYKCQFAHGKEEMRPSRFISNSKSEAAKSKPHFSSGSTTHGGKGGILHNLEMETTPLSSPSKHEPSSSTSSQCKTPDSTTSVSDWCPLDDGINVVSTGSVYTSNACPSREDVNSSIMNVLYGPPRRQKRLPVFEDICSNK